VKAVLRRSQALPASGPVLRAGPLVVDRARREARVGEQPVALRGQEFDLLAVLVEHQGMALSREQLLEMAWGFDYYGETRTVDVHVAQLRQRLACSPVSIETVWGVGYKLVVS
jgi:DNA-binding response OmpR family regulator